MITCPRCGNAVDETTRTTCPTCLTPLQSQAGSPPLNAPQPPGGQPGQAVPLNAPPAQPLNAPPGQPGMAPQAGALPPPSASMHPQVRRTLAGDVIEETPAATAYQPTQPGGYAGGAHGGMPSPGGPPMTSRPAGYPGARRGETASAQKAGGGAGLAVVVVTLLLLGGFGGWWFMAHRSNPKQQADKFFVALKALDFKGIYETMEVDTAKYPTEDSFVQQNKEQMDKAPGAAELAKGLLSSMEATTGEPTINGDEATVPVTMKISFQGQTTQRNLPLKMKNIGGIWKVSKDNQGVSGPIFGAGSSGGASGGTGAPGGSP